jgi:glycerol uptake facilitator-like aquaporin
MRWKNLLLSVFLGIAAFVIMGALSLVVDSLFGMQFPRWSVLQWLGVAFLFGLAQLVGEFLFQPVQRYVIDPDKRNDALWKRGLRVFVLVGIFIIPLVGFLYWQGR